MKRVQINLDYTCGLQVSMIGCCPQCQSQNNAEVADEAYERLMLKLPDNIVNVIHSGARVTRHSACPYCKLPALTGTLKENYNHLHKCASRPMVCKLCDTEVALAQYYKHLQHSCIAWQCGYTGCKDGRSQGTLYDVIGVGFKLSELRSHYQSHLMFDDAKQLAIDQLYTILNAVPHYSAAQRVRAGVVITTCMDTLSQTIRLRLNIKEKEENDASTSSAFDQNRAG